MYVCLQIVLIYSIVNWASILAARHVQCIEFHDWLINSPPRTTVSTNCADCQFRRGSPVDKHWCKPLRLQDQIPLQSIFILFQPWAPSRMDKYALQIFIIIIYYYYYIPRSDAMGKRLLKKATLRGKDLFALTNYLYILEENYWFL